LFSTEGTSRLIGLTASSSSIGVLSLIRGLPAGRIVLSKAAGSSCSFFN
jgi:hypothetical protein